MKLYAIAFKGSALINGISVKQKTLYWIFNETARTDGNPLQEKLDINCLTDSKTQIQRFLEHADKRYKAVEYKLTKA